MNIELVGSEPLYQWDTGRQVVITPDDDTVGEVHFSYKDAEEALVVAIDEDMTANIPNILLQQTKPLKVYAVVHTERGRHSVHTESLTITKRAKPSDYAYTETEILRYEDLEQRLEELEKNSDDAGVTAEDIKDALDYAH